MNVTVGIRVMSDVDTIFKELKQDASIPSNWHPTSPKKEGKHSAKKSKKGGKR